MQTCIWFGSDNFDIAQLFHGVLKDHVPTEIFSRAEKQARVASSRLKGATEDEKQEKLKE